MNKRLLIITPGYIPAKNYGGPVVSISNIVSNLGGEYDIYIITSNYEFKGNERLVNNNEKFVEVNGAKVYYLDKNQMKYQYLNQLIDKIFPDIVYINALFHYKLTLPVLKICKQRNIHSIIAPRGGVCKNALEFGKYKKIGYIFFLKGLGYLKKTKFQSTSDEETEGIEKYLCNKKEKIYEISNLPAPFSPVKKSQNKKSGYLKVVFFSRIHPKKNLLFAIETLQKVTGNVQFDIYGPIEDHEYWSICQRQIKKGNNNVIIKYCGYLDHDAIPETLSQYQLFFFPTLSENYGHVIVEALESDCLVLLSNNTPWNDVEKYDVGRAYCLESFSPFVEYINEIIEMDNAEFEKRISFISSYLDDKLKVSELLDKYRELFE